MTEKVTRLLADPPPDGDLKKKLKGQEGLSAEGWVVGSHLICARGITGTLAIANTPARSTADCGTLACAGCS